MNSRELYPFCYSDDEYIWNEPHDYTPIINSLGIVNDKCMVGNNFNGNIVVFLSDNNSKRVGYCEIPYGYNSDDDALQSCNSYNEIDILIKNIKDSVIWFDNYVDALEWFQHYDWELTHLWQSENFREFLCYTMKWLICRVSKEEIHVDVYYFFLKQIEEQNNNKRSNADFARALALEFDELTSLV